MYSRSPVVLLDDVLSALDAPVAAAVFRSCVQEACAGRTRVIVSHDERIAAVADCVITLEAAGGWSFALHHQPTAAVVATYEEGAAGGGDVRDATTLQPSQPTSSDKLSLQTVQGTPKMAESATATETLTPSISDLTQEGFDCDGASGDTTEKEAEGAHQTLGPLEFVRQLVKGIGGWRFALPIFACAAGEIAVVEMSVWFLSLYTTDPAASAAYYMPRYAALVMAEVAIAYVRQRFLVWGSRSSAHRLESALLSKVIGGTAGELERLGFARLLHFFTQDLSKLDPLSTYMTTEYVWARLQSGAGIDLPGLWCNFGYVCTHLSATCAVGQGYLCLCCILHAHTRTHYYAYGRYYFYGIGFGSVIFIVLCVFSAWLIIPAVLSAAAVYLLLRRMRRAQECSHQSVGV